MDLTSNFTSLVKTLRSRSRALGDVDEARSPRPHKKKNRFNAKAKDVVGNISQMRDFFLEHRKDYIDAHYIMYNASRMSDIEREEIDSEAHKFIAKCKQVIGNLRKEINTCPATAQQKEHLVAVISMIEEYLRVVARIWSDQKTLRMRRAIRMKEIGSLTGGRPMKEVLGGTPEPSERVKADDDEGFDEQTGKEGPTENLIPKKTSYYEEYPIEELATVEITQADVLALEEENTRLYDELNSMAEQVKQIEGKVVEISELQKQFADKVIEQDVEAERIATVMVKATDNVRDANEQLRQAMQNSAGLRVVILFVLIVLSFSLLFLDWYNP